MRLSPIALRHVVRCLVLGTDDAVASARARDELALLYGDVVREIWHEAMCEMAQRARTASKRVLDPPTR